MSGDTDTITIRVPCSLKDQLEEMSEKQEITLNLLINRILSKNVKWDSHLAKMGWLHVQPSSTKEIFSRLDEKKISEIAESIKNDVINGIKFIYGEATLQNTVDFIETWLESTNSTFRYIENENSHKFIVNHEMGKNWSDFAIKVTKEFTKQLGFEVINSSSETNVYSYEILKK